MITSHSIEPLEDRIAPAGVVIATYVADTGELTLTGDTLDNNVAVFQTGTNTYRVEGNGTAINVIQSNFLEIGKLTKLTIVGSDGGDTFTLTNLRTLTALSFTGGDGSDHLDAFNLTVKGGVEIHGNTGSDSVTFDGLSTKISGNVTADSSGGATDRISMSFNAQKTVIGGSVFINGGGGDDFLQAFGEGPMSIAKGVNFNAGAGGGTLDLSNNDLLTIGKLATGESILFTGGDGFDTLRLGGVNATLAGGIRMTGDAKDDVIEFNNDPGTVKVGKLATGESILFDGGTGNNSIDTAAVSLTLAGGIDFTASSGTNALTLGGANGAIKIGTLATGESIRFDGGFNDDTLTTSSANLTLAGGILFLAHAGTNALTLDAPNGSIKIGKLATGPSIDFIGGSQDDTLTTNSASLTLAGGIDFDASEGTNRIDVLGANGKASLGTFGPGVSIRFFGEIGDDTLHTDVASLTLGGGIIFSTGDGTNLLDLVSPNGVVKIGALAGGPVVGNPSIFYIGGTDGDTLHTDVASLTLAAAITFRPGDGTNLIDLESANGVAKIGTLGDGRSILLTGGTGSDDITSNLARVTLAGGIEFNDAGGRNHIEFDDHGVVKFGKFGTGQSVLFTGTTDADNEVRFGGFVTLAGSVEVTGGTGSDEIALRGKVSVGKSAAGVSVLLTGGDGADVIRLQDNITLAGSLKLDGGNNDDTMDLDSVDTLIVKGAVDFDGGAGVDSFDVVAFAVVFGSTLTVTGGDDADTFSINADGSIAGDVNVDLGLAAAGTQTLVVTSKSGVPSGLALKGALTVDATAATTADFLTITNVSVAKLIDLKLGEGVSTVNIDNLNAGDEFKLDTRGGADVVNFERRNFFGGSVIKKLATIHLGLGDDKLAIGGPNPTVIAPFPDNTRVNFMGGLTTDGGGGANDNRNLFENDNTFGVPLTPPVGFELATLV